MKDLIFKSFVEVALFVVFTSLVSLTMGCGSESLSLKNVKQEMLLLNNWTSIVSQIKCVKYSFFY